MSNDTTACSTRAASRFGVYGVLIMASIDKQNLGQD